MEEKGGGGRKVGGRWEEEGRWGGEGGGRWGERGGRRGGSMNHGAAAWEALHFVTGQSDLYDHVPLCVLCFDIVKQHVEAEV